MAKKRNRHWNRQLIRLCWRDLSGADHRLNIKLALADWLYTRCYADFKPGSRREMRLRPTFYCLRVEGILRLYQYRHSELVPIAEYILRVRTNTESWKRAALMDPAPADMYDWNQIDVTRGV